MANYEEIAVRLAQEPASLRELRDKLAASVKGSPLFNPPRFVRALESVYEEMGHNHDAGRPPRPIELVDSTGKPIAMACCKFQE